MMTIKTVVTIEARTGSSRLPAKVLKPILGEPMLARIIERVKRCRKINEIVVATTDREEDRVLVDLANRCGVSAYCGSELDILDRLAGAADKSAAGILVSLTGDNPFIDPDLIDDMVDSFPTSRAEYMATTHMQHARYWKAKRTFPTGVSVQIVYADLIRKMHQDVKDASVRELGLYCIYDDPSQRFSLSSFEAVGKYAAWRHPSLRMTVDTLADFELAVRVYESLYPKNPAFPTGDAIRLLLDVPEIQHLNRHVQQKIGHEAVTESSRNSGVCR